MLHTRLFNVPIASLETSPCQLCLQHSSVIIIRDIPQCQHDPSPVRQPLSRGTLPGRPLGNPLRENLPPDFIKSENSTKNREVSSPKSLHNCR
ncbi:hypothetical protein AVEN_109595-1 [Araneus ventricosus]|uniref:Uncharacterized protein n=1 Tax=Araneus ventricosus TaxID=182803 RepID=A0A4Y2LQR7_ARAVE|nr:hypothetical protein AVEN_109595-1 [Araneus ventricosus]